MLLAYFQRAENLENPENPEILSFTIGFMKDLKGIYKY